MINKKKILEELYEYDSSFKLEEEKTEKLVSFLVKNNPDIEAPKAFKTRLGNKLHTIGEFKQIQPKTKRSFMFFMRPLFVLIVGVFVLAQFKNYLSIKEVNMKNIPELQNLEILIPDNENSLLGEGEEENQKEELSKTEQKINLNTNGEESFAGASSSDSSSNETSIIETSNNDNKEEQNGTILQELESSEEDAGIKDSQDETDVLSQGTILSADEEDISNKNSGDTVGNESQDQVEVFTSVILSTSNDIDISEEMSQDTSSEEEYYTCDDGNIVIEDSIAQRRVIKSYCDDAGGEIINGGGNIKYYLCTLPSKEEVGIEYIEKKLCE